MLAFSNNKKLGWLGHDITAYVICGVDIMWIDLVDVEVDVYVMSVIAEMGNNSIPDNVSDKAAVVLQVIDKMQYNLDPDGVTDVAIVDVDVKNQRACLTNLI